MRRIFIKEEKNITQEGLADFMMVTKASVSKWESGQS
ncbi:MAG: helix-turn-helix transcriptional regulator [[Eubacterium] sulci]|nr:helix-turn-helix transcriptional regulator [[Eubacterium] sulci]